ncbi:MAG: heavy metal transporter, partial [Clostridia bacterium]|nr:heavy metal transporter [Clostridia bacterium]
IHADEEKITGCNNEMVIPALDLRVQLSPGDNIVEFTVDEHGVIPYTCWMGMLNGSITVVEGE